MKSPFLALAFLVLTDGAAGAETRSATMAPQPRPRLDPALQATVPPPTIQSRKPSDPPYMLERLIVKERPAIPIRPPAVQDPKGEFSPIDGGRLWRKDRGAFRMEAGIWPSIELFEEEARFRPTKTRIDFDFLRIKW